MLAVGKVNPSKQKQTYPWWQGFSFSQTSMLVFFSQSVSHFSHTTTALVARKGEREREQNIFNLEKKRNLVSARPFKKAKAVV